MRTLPFGAAERINQAKKMQEVWKRERWNDDGDSEGRVSEGEEGYYRR